jgi:prepilin-type N-terminal cleavage/methylation domain-containing protein
LQQASFSRSQGFTLVELMVAMVIGLILMLGITAVFSSNKQTYKMQNTLTRMQENGRYGVDLIARDLRRAGYWAANVDIDSVSGSEGLVTPAVACDTGNNNWGRMVEEGLFGINDANTGYACIPDDDYLRGDLLLVRYASPDIAGTLQTNRLYLRASLFDGRIFKGSQSGSNDIPGEVTTTRELVSHAFYIGPSDQQCPDGSTVPALFWETLDANGRPAEEQLVIGAEHLQVLYGADADGNGSVENYVNASDVANWDNITSVRFWLLVRADCADPRYTDNNSYNMGTWPPISPTTTSGASSTRRRCHCATELAASAI